jgi:hypothetical protein
MPAAQINEKMMSRHVFTTSAREVLTFNSDSPYFIIMLIRATSSRQTAFVAALRMGCNQG